MSTDFIKSVFDALGWKDEFPLQKTLCKAVLLKGAYDRIFLKTTRGSLRYPGTH